MYSVRHPARRYDREYIAYPISVFSLCVAGLICRCGSVGKHGGFCFFSFPAVSMIPCPHPPSPPFPAGRGSPKVYFAGGEAPGTPALNRLRHLQTLPCRSPAGGLPGRSPADLAFSFISFPHPPAPPFPSGRGLLVFLCKGLRPLHPRARAESGTGCTCVAGARRGGLPGRSAADLALSFIGCPHPPAPLPVGKGESQSLFRRGLRPRHPCIESPTALADAAVREPGGWLARLVAGSPCL